MRPYLRQLEWVAEDFARLRIDDDTMVRLKLCERAQTVCHRLQIENERNGRSGAHEYDKDTWVILVWGPSG